MFDEEKRKIHFIQNQLPKLILNRNEKFRGMMLLHSEVKANNQLDGFMSSLYFLNLKMKTADGR